MKKLTLPLLGIWILGFGIYNLLNGQVDLYGYFEPQYSGLYIDTAYYQSSYGKVRVDLKSTEVKNVRFGADVIYTTYFGKKTWNVLDFIPDDIAYSIPSDMRPYYQYQFNDTFYLDNAYARLSIKRLAVTIGKQQISFGTGYFSNPTDVLNNKDALDPTYEQSGHNAIRLEVYPMPRVSLTAIYTPIAADWENSGKLGRAKIGVGHFDLSALGYIFQHTSTNFYTFEQTIQEHRMIGGDLVGELLGLGVWAEGMYTFMEYQDDNFYEFLTGVDYTFEGGFYIMCEYHHSSLAKYDHHNYTLNDWMRYITGECKTLSRDQMYGLVQYPLTDFVSIGSMGIFSLSDQSAAIIPMVNYCMYENVNLTLMLNLYFGEEGRMFSKNYGAGGSLRANVYF